MIIIVLNVFLISISSPRGGREGVVKRADLHRQALEEKEFRNYENSKTLKT
jgi:hypothetical protein